MAKSLIAFTVVALLLIPATGLCEKIKVEQAVPVAVNESSKVTANPGVLGAALYHIGEEYNTDQFKSLLKLYNYGSIRTSHYEQWNWAANRSPYYRDMRKGIEEGWIPFGYIDQAGHILSLQNIIDIAKQATPATTICWSMNMSGEADCYGRAVPITGDTDYIQGSYPPGYPFDITIEAEKFNASSDSSIGTITCSDSSGRAVSCVVPGNWIKWNQYDAGSAKFQIQIRVASANSDMHAHVEIDGTNAGTINFGNTGGKDSWTTINGPTVTLTPARHEIKFVMDTGGFALNWIRLHPTGNTGNTFIGRPTESDKANWCTVGNTSSIYEQAKDLAKRLRNANVPHIFEFGNEIYFGLPVTEAYWKDTSGKITRVCWAASWGNYDKLVRGSDDPNSNDCDMEFDWSTGKTYTSSSSIGNALYIGFPYKPISIDFLLKTAGVGGTLKWQHQRSDGKWHDITPQGGTYCEYTDVEHRRWYTVSPTLHPAEYKKLCNFSEASRDPSTNQLIGFSTIYLLPLPRMYDYLTGQWIGDTPAKWDAKDDPKNLTGPYHNDWVRTQPSELKQGSSNVRKLYWLRITAATPYTTLPREANIKGYRPDFRSWLATCNQLYTAIKSVDPKAEVYNVGLMYNETPFEKPYNSCYATDFHDAPYWYYLTKSANVKYWDGLVIHPYVASGNPDTLVTAADDGKPWGVMKQIDDMRKLLDQTALSTKKIACTEWGNVIDPIDAALAEGVFCLDATLSMMQDRADGRSRADYAMWWMDLPLKSWGFSPYYSNPQPNVAPGSQMKLIERPTSFAMRIAAKAVRKYAYGQISGDDPNLKIYPFSDDNGANRCIVIINRGGTEESGRISWSGLTGTAKALTMESNQSQPSLLDNNEAINKPQVDLTESDAGTADSDIYSYTVPAYSATLFTFTP